MRTPRRTPATRVQCRRDRAAAELQRRADAEQAELAEHQRFATEAGRFWIGMGAQPPAIPTSSWSA